jgi:DNA-binding NarL/FixJ family response regulator
MHPSAHLVRVLIVAADPLTRAGLAAVLALRADCQVAGQLAPDDLLSAPGAAFDHDVVLVDLGWEVGPGQELLPLPKVRERPVVALVTGGAQAGAAWDGGAQGILPRDVPVGRLVAALQAVHEGLVALDPELAGAVRAPREAGLPPLAEPLTPRELEVLHLLAEGLPNKAIAQRLGISENTVKFHVNVILGKLGAQSRTEAVTRAVRLGLILL